MSSDADGEERPRNPAPKTKKGTGHVICVDRERDVVSPHVLSDPRRCRIFAKAREGSRVTIVLNMNCTYQQKTKSILELALTMNVEKKAHPVYGKSPSRGISG
ncbi:hypothetical protein DFH08DRAFT_929244 [Mycena albidolilacea]|uniref:Uncharacterized protein n=1 Tax=Mycena albidolilacea TaxID=1033008 RepID=A0AAD7F556_9AGAR|nr:hypothetical protein DFH08DRAFT_929244 [Mycena albidolilacea]